jgi:RNA:NAD 2'-phosphotransferase (TPT1/KptA family)
MEQLLEPLHQLIKMEFQNNLVNMHISQKALKQPDQVESRHRNAAVLKRDSKRMSEDGFIFYLSES